jgi:hypothetical protein
VTKEKYMQTDYRYNWMKGYKRFCHHLGMISEEANQRYKILQFFDRYGLEATKEVYTCLILLVRS